VASVYLRGRRLWCKYRDASGEVVRKPTRYNVGQEDLARRYVRRKEELASEKRARNEIGTPTVKVYGERWIAARKGRVATWRDEDTRLKLHLYPTLGSMKLDEVRPRHVRDWVLGLRAQRDEDGEPALAPRTIRHVFQTVGRMFRSAFIEELVATSPVLVDKGVLPPNVDRDPGWRPGAVFARAELVQLISAAAVPADRQVFYGLQGLGGLRSGEAARLRWRDYEPDLEPLGRLSVLKTKTGVPRQVPAHPTLASMLAEWKLGGWAAAFGRRPEPDDLIVPLLLQRKSRRGKPGALVERTDNQAAREDDLAALGLRHRRGHDLRRTMITLARQDGARADLLEVVTHGPKSGDMISLYTTFPWAALCAEVSRLQVARSAPSDIVPLRSALGTV
jgi:integrase